MRLIARFVQSWALEKGAAGWARNRHPGTSAKLVTSWMHCHIAHGLRHSAAPILNHMGNKDLREIQELLRRKNIRTTVRCTHVGYEQTRQTPEALQALE
jgi:site-specific recombinase XerC